MHDKTGKIEAIENAKLKLLKLLSSKNNVISFLQHLTLETFNRLDILG